MTKTSTKPAGGKRLLQNKLFSITLILVGMVIIAALTSEYFMTAYNLQSVIRDLAFIGIIAIGQSCLRKGGQRGFVNPQHRQFLRNIHIDRQLTHGINSGLTVLLFSHAGGVHTKGLSN